MLAKINSSAVIGLDATPIEVEVDIASQGLPNFTKVGTQYLQLDLKLKETYLHEALAM